jgi:hypothetical protein
MRRLALFGPLLTFALLPRPAQAQLQEMRQNIFGMD